MKKTITTIQDLITTFDLNLSEKEKKQLSNFLKKKVIHVVDKKITYPKIEEIKKKEKEISKNISELEKELSFWKGNRSEVIRKEALFPVTIYFKKNFWRHKIKELTNKEYKQDVIDSKLTDKILLDPEYSTLFETFLINPDYRKKLKETVNNSIVYKNNGIGTYSEKKKDFKLKASEMKIEQLKKQIEQLYLKREEQTKIAEIIKKYS